MICGGAIFAGAAFGRAWWNWREENVGRQAAGDHRALAEAVLNFWSRPSQLLGRRMLEKYGLPERVESSRLIWTRCAPWKRTIVWDQTPPYVETEPPRVMEQVVAYDVTYDMIGAIEAFNDDLIIRRDKRELSVMSDGEETSFLTVNLADDVVRGLRNAEEARSFYHRTRQLTMAGKTSPYTQRLLFMPMEEKK